MDTEEKKGWTYGSLVVGILCFIISGMVYNCSGDYKSTTTYKLTPENREIAETKAIEAVTASYKNYKQGVVPPQRWVSDYFGDIDQAIEMDLAQSQEIKVTTNEIPKSVFYKVFGIAGGVCFLVMIIFLISMSNLYNLIKNRIRVSIETNQGLKEIEAKKVKETLQFLKRTEDRLMQD